MQMLETQLKEYVEIYYDADKRQQVKELGHKISLRFGFRPIQDFNHPLLFGKAILYKMEYDRNDTTLNYRYLIPAHIGTLCGYAFFAFCRVLESEYVNIEEKITALMYLQIITLHYKANFVQHFLNSYCNNPNEAIFPIASYIVNTYNDMTLYNSITIDLPVQEMQMFNMAQSKIPNSVSFSRPSTIQIGKNIIDNIMMMTRSYRMI